MHQKEHKKSNSTDRTALSDGTAFVLPYIPGVSQKISHAWKKTASFHDLDHRGLDSRIVHKPLGNLKLSLCNLYPAEEPGRCVYRATCTAENCTDTYIGESGLLLEKRKQRHSQDKNSAIASHHHAVSDFDFAMLSREKDSNKRRIKEAILIKRENPTLNRDIGVHSYLFP